MDMQNNQDAIRKAMQLAQTAEGQQLLRLLQSTDGAGLQAAMDRAAAGDYTAAKKALSGILNNPEARRLLQQMGGNYGSDGR
jgi:hypothetical protein